MRFKYKWAGITGSADVRIGGESVYSLIENDNKWSHAVCAHNHLKLIGVGGAKVGHKRIGAVESSQIARYSGIYDVIDRC